MISEIINDLELSAEVTGGVGTSMYVTADARFYESGGRSSIN